LPDDIKNNALWGSKIHSTEDKAFPAAKEQLYESFVANISP
jgi:hypothetical protein